MATFARRKPAEDRSPLKRTRSLAFKLITDTTNAAVGAFTGRKQHNDPTTDRRPRPVLLPIHTNVRPLRRNSRMALNRVGSASTRSGSYSASTGSQSPGMVENVPLSAGKKRKRGGNENYDGTELGMHSGERGKGSLKRSKSAYATLAAASRSAMDIDEFGAGNSQQKARRTQSQHEDNNEDTELEDVMDSSDDHYISSAPAWQLQKLRKEDLVRLYTLADLGMVNDELTKTDIVNAIIDARKCLKTSSTPAGSARSPSSSHTDGNDAGAEESDAPTEDVSRKKKLRRSATTHAQLGLGHPTTRLTSSKSMDVGAENRRSSAGGRSMRRTRFMSDLKRTRLDETRLHQAAASSSPGPSADDVFVSRQATGTRTRSRQTSHVVSSNDSKGKGKRVEFSDEAAETTEEESHEGSSDEWVDERTPTKRRAVDSEATPIGIKRSTGTREGLSRSASKKSIFSPKKLRPRTSRQNLRSLTNLTNVANDGSPANRTVRRQSSRRTWARKAKPEGSLREPSSSDDSRDFAEDVEEQDELAEDEEFHSAEEDVDEIMGEASQNSAQPDAEEESDLTELSEEETPVQAVEGESDLTEEEDNEENNVGEQVEQIPLEQTPRPTRTRSTRKIAVDPPPIKRSTSRRGSNRTSGGQKRSSKNRRTAGVEAPAEEDDEAAEAPDADDIEVDEDEAVGDSEESVEPRVLRNGKVVGDTVEEEAEDEDEDDAAESGAEAIEEDGAEDDGEEVEEVEEPEGIDDDGDLEDDFDLSEATHKSLTRLRRDDLVKLCETRDLEVEGTKGILIQNLLEWRDAKATAPSSSTQPSSNASTVRAPSTRRPNQNGSPVLLRSDRVHVTQPRTPDPDPDAPSVHLIGSKAREKEREPDELELDLESLGLEDREIPIEKLTKLEKIGSGGFKDVFIGKYKGRKVAIAEFRGHLGPMDIKELKLLADFNHENVVRFLGVSIPEDTKNTPVMMVSELCTNGDLFDYVRNVPPPPLKKVLRLMLDIANGINYLHNIHKPSVIHRDCKSSNILITAKVTAKIADFGLAKVKQSTRSMVKSLVGTVNWQAPELWHAHPKYDHKVDVFSCAMVFWEILQWHNPSKKYPWEGMNEHAIYEEVGAKKHRPSVAGLRKLWCPAVVDLMERMWRQDPKERPPISEVVDDLETIIANL